MTYFRATIIRSLIYFALALVIVVGGLVFLRSSISAAVSRVQVLRGQLSEREANSGQLASLHEDYESTIREYTKILENYVPERDRLVHISKDIENEGVRSGVNVSVAQAEEVPPNGSTFGYVAYSVVATGDSPQVEKFFDGLKQFRYLISREGFSINFQDNVFRASSRIKVYYRTL